MTEDEGEGNEEEDEAVTVYNWQTRDGYDGYRPHTEIRLECIF
jgi:hypothetical protein